MEDFSEEAVAALLAEEASQLRYAAGFQGYSAFLQKPTVRARPNKQFLAATVRSVESANRMAQMSEMWQLRQKELSEEEGSDGRGRDSMQSKRNARKRKPSSDGQAPPPHKQPAKGGTENTQRHRAVKGAEEYPVRGERSSLEGLSDRSTSPDELRNGGARGTEGSEQPVGGGAGVMGLEAFPGEDDDLDEFLNSRRKRGRGAVGSRIDEPGPFAAADTGNELEKIEASAKSPVIQGPQLPPQLDVRRKKGKESDLGRSSLELSRATGRKKRRQGSKEERRARKEGRKKRKKREKSRERK